MQPYQFCYRYGVKKKVIRNRSRLLAVQQSLLRRRRYS